MRPLVVTFAGFLLIAGSVWAEDEEFSHTETVFAVTRCRAACLDEFSHIIRNEETCKKETECFMCWETCKMLNENYKLWGPMCAIRDICSPGCAFACKSIESYSDYGKSNPSVVNLKSVYDPERNYVNIEWITEQDIQSEGAILYVLLLKDSNQFWRVISQTTSHILKVRKAYLDQDTIIRLLGVNSTEVVSDTAVSFLDSLLLAPMAPAAYMQSSNTTWKPHMQSIELFDSFNKLLQATISWPKMNGFEPLKYEVLWNVIDSLDITGHLYITTNTAVITLWQDSIYSIQVKCFSAFSEKLITQSEFLIIDTHSQQYAESSASVSPCFKGSTCV
ncbi:uncharacterized protein LOC129219032 [Uloborus diversus]|uniref:uncharacterized protein LOC129219032 n=1 Tax=Uloborus diversus TaxID=327109 RepID=UPI00240A7116|nr:uncharacterized protein LOC129219032 [Uloborus diversus]